MELQKVYDVLNLLMERFRKMDLCGVGVFKICMLSLGMLIGLYAHRACRRFSPLLWLVFIASYAALIYRLLIRPALSPEHA